MGNKKVWLIDENEQEIWAYKKLLRRIFQGRVDVAEIYPPFPTKQDYHQLLDDPETATIIIDQRLKDTGVASYTGIELANHLRSIDTKIPLYILTNFAEDFEKSSDLGWSVEDIIDKGKLASDEKTKKETGARILRRINIYDDILDEREKRFHDLLVKSLTQPLGDDEFGELEKLQEIRTSAVLADEIGQLKQLETAVKKHAEILRSLGLNGSRNA